MTFGRLELAWQRGLKPGPDSLSLGRLVLESKMETHSVLIVLIDVAIASWLFERLKNGYRTQLIGNFEVIAVVVFTVLLVTALVLSMNWGKQLVFTSCCVANCDNGQAVNANNQSTDCLVHGQTTLDGRTGYTTSFFNDNWAPTNQQRNKSLTLVNRHFLSEPAVNNK